MSESHSTDFARQLELAWAAGFFDGEGWTSVARDKRNGYCMVMAGIGQVNREPLERVLKALGGKIYGPYRVGNRFGKQPQFQWKVDGLAARRALDLLWPYLTEVKRQQALRALGQDTGSGRPKPEKRTHCPRGHEYGGGNLAFKKNGNRRCLACEGILKIAYRERARENQRRYRAKKLALAQGGGS